MPAGATDELVDGASAVFRTSAREGTLVDEAFGALARVLRGEPGAAAAR